MRPLQVFALAIMLIPSVTVVAAVGAGGYPAALIALLLLGLYVASAAFGLHDPLERRSPIRLALCAMWVVSLLSYGKMQLDPPGLVEQLSADRWLLQLAAISGVVLVTAEFLHGQGDVRRVLRALVAGGGFCGAVAALQYWAHVDLSSHLTALPGFVQTYEHQALGSRGALPRVAGTALSPIELGVVAGMLIPLAVHLALQDATRGRWRRWLPVVCIAAGVSTSVSRSAVLSVGVSMTIFLAAMPPRQRRSALLCLPAALLAVFFTSPGLLTTLVSFFRAGRSDPSVGTRVDDYPMVERLVQEAPLLGRGGGTFLPRDVFDILDNQYLKSAIELGLLGVVVLVLYLAVPVGVALAARTRSADPDLRQLTAALAGACTSALVCSFTFDSLSFPMFTLVHALLIGSVAACWRTALDGDAATAGAGHRPMRVLVADGGSPDETPRSS